MILFLIEVIQNIDDFSYHQYNLLFIKIKMLQKSSGALPIIFSALKAIH